MEIARQMLVEAIQKAAHEVFVTMLDLEPVTGDAFTESLPQPSGDGLVAFVGLSGRWAGIGSVCCPTALACNWSGRMLMTECTSLDADVLDAVAELTNMLIGNVKTELEAKLGPMGLSIPTVIFGRNFQMKSARNVEWTVVPFTCEGERFEIKLCLAPDAEAGHRSTICQTCPVQV